MKRLLNIARRVLVSGWLGTLLGIALIGICMFLAFGTSLKSTSAIYVCYFLSAYGLTLLVFNVILAVPPMIAKMKEMPVVGRYMQDSYYKVWLSLRFSFAVNLLFAVVKMFYAVRSSSFWEGGLAGYYILLCIVRYFLLRRVPVSPDAVDEQKEWKDAKAAGHILFALDVALVGIATQIVRDGQSYYYAGSLIYVMALYAFYSVGASVNGLIKYRKFKSPLLSATKTVNLTCGMVAILSLETAMLTRYAGPDELRFSQTMTACTALVICLIALALAATMVTKARKNIKQVKQEVK